MLVFGDGVLRLHNLGRGCKDFKSGLVFIMKITLFSPADQGHINSASGGTGFGKPSRHFKIYALHCSDL